MIKADNDNVSPIRAIGRKAKMNGANSGGVDAAGVLDSRRLPDSEFLALWDAVLIDEEQKQRLLSQAILNFTLRGKVDRATCPLHGLIMLYGPPGTGKTSLARGLAARVAEAVNGIGEFLYIEVEPHALASAALGRSQRAVRDLLNDTIGGYASSRPLVVVLDEVETLAADRAKLSLEANPVDVHRATDAVLAQLDQLAANHPHLLFIATSNFTKAVDGAFLSRADAVEHIGLPDVRACRAILEDSLKAFAREFPEAKSLTVAPEFEEAAKKCVGLDGRRIRKLVATACAVDPEVALNPGKLQGRHLVKAVSLAHEELKRMGEERA